MRIAKCSQCPRVYKGKYANIQLANHRRFKHAPSNGAVPLKTQETFLSLLGELNATAREYLAAKGKLLDLQERIRAVKF